MREQRWGTVGRVEEGSDEGGRWETVSRVEEGSDEGGAMGKCG